MVYNVPFDFVVSLLYCCLLITIIFYFILGSVGRDQPASISMSISNCFIMKMTF